MEKTYSCVCPFQPLLSLKRRGSTSFQVLSNFNSYSSALATCGTKIGLSIYSFIDVFDRIL